ncbi:MAG: DUF6116 family protein [Acidobacteriota bacterium]
MSRNPTAGAAAPKGLGRLLGRLSSKTLLFGVGALFLADLVILDPLPWIDEIVLAILTLLVARWRSRNEPPPVGPDPKPPPRDVTPRS